MAFFDPVLLADSPRILRIDPSPNFSRNLEPDSQDSGEFSHLVQEDVYPLVRMWIYAAQLFRVCLAPFCNMCLLLSILFTDVWLGNGACYSMNMMNAIMLRVYISLPQKKC